MGAPRKRSHSLWKGKSRVNPKPIIPTLPLHLMVWPGLLLILVFNYGPILGLVMAFQKFYPARGFLGSEWIGWTNFEYVFKLPDFKRALWNTLYIAVLKLVGHQVVSISIALLINEAAKVIFRRAVQTLIYLPHFLSWVILSGILIDILSPSTGIVNDVITFFGFEPIFFLADNRWFPSVIILSDIWKDFGFGTIVYFAAILSINPALYEAASIDGATRWQKVRHVTLPGMLPIVVLLATLSLGKVLNAGFDQIFNLYSPITYRSGDIIDTLVYRVGLEQAQFSVAAAVGLFKSAISFIMICASYVLAYRYANYRIF